MFWSSILKTVSKLRKRKESCCLVFPSSAKREFRHFHVVVGRQRQRNVQKNLMHVQSCCFANQTYSFFFFCRSRCSSLLKLPIKLVAAAHSGQGCNLTYRRLWGSEFESRLSHTSKATYWVLYLFRLLIIFSLCFVSLYSHCWFFKASRGFCNNVFLIVSCQR